MRESERHPLVNAIVTPGARAREGAGEKVSLGPGRREEGLNCRLKAWTSAQRQ